MPSHRVLHQHEGQPGRHHGERERQQAPAHRQRVRTAPTDVDELGGHRDEGPVPQVEAVGQPTQPLQWRPAQQQDRAHAPGCGSGEQDQRGATRRQQRPEAGEERLPRDDDEREDDERQPGPAGHRRHPPRQPWPGTGPERDDRAQHQLVHPRRGDEVGGRLLERPPPGQRERGAEQCQGDDPGGGAEDAGPARGIHEEAEQDHRPQEVELLLDGQRPVVLQRAGGALQVEVVHRAPRHAPVDDVGRGGDEVTTHLSPPATRQEDHREQRRPGERGEGGRQQSAGAARVEPGEVDPPAGPPLLQQEGGHEETADDEEDVHPGETTGQQCHPGVPEHDPEHRERAHALDVGAEAARDGWHPQRVPRGVQRPGTGPGERCLVGGHGAPTGRSAPAPATG